MEDRHNYIPAPTTHWLRFVKNLNGPNFCGLARPMLRGAQHAWPGLFTIIVNFPAGAGPCRLYWTHSSSEKCSQHWIYIYFVKISWNNLKRDFFKYSRFVTRTAQPWKNHTSFILTPFRFEIMCRWTQGLHIFSILDLYIYISQHKFF